MKNKKLVFSLFLGIMLSISSHAQYINFAEALQKSLYFYDAEKCGAGISGAKLEWRGDCHLEDAEFPLNEKLTDMSTAFIANNLSILDPDGNGTIDLGGGYHDAGDHVQFGLPQSYSSQTLEWALYEFPNSFKNTGEYEHILDITKWASDYYLKCTYRDAAGDIIAFCYQVGEGNEDHNFWGPPELQSVKKYPRKAYFATKEKPASDQCAGAAASLALTYLNRKEIDSAYANRCLNTAIELYKFAVENRGLGYSGGFYNSSFDEDELSLAAVWLNIATGNTSYIDDVISKDAAGVNTGWLKKIISTSQDDWQNIWVHSWDTKWGGVFAKLAPITNDPMHWYIFRWNIEYWANIPHENTNDGTFIKQTPAGFSWIAGWGSARYNAAAQFCALVYCKTKDRIDFRNWAKGQMEYIMGDNPLKRSYIVGYSGNYASHPHHRASHGSSSNSALIPVDHHHVLWGALVGGPDASDGHKDETNDYIYNEVAIDYNAGFVGALAGHYFFYGNGHEPIADFPPLEGKKKEYFIEAKLEQENNQRTQVTISIGNSTVHPPRIGSSLKAQYYFNVSEMIQAGQSIDDVKMEIYYDASKAADTNNAVVSSGPHAYDVASGVYFYEFEWKDINFYGQMDLQFALIAKINSKWEYTWDPTNDFSRTGLDSTLKESPYIPIFADGKHYSGLFPRKDTGNSNIAVTGVTIIPSSVFFRIGETKTLIANVIPAYASNKNVVWKSDSLSVATVDSNGVIEAISEGIATITATTEDGGFVASATINVISNNSSDCNFGAPSLEPLPKVNSSFSHIHVLGNGPDLKNITTTAINWELESKSLWQLSMNTNDGKPDWYVDLTSKNTNTFGSPLPTITFSATGIAGLDGSYFVTMDGENLVLVDQGGAFTLYFSNVATAPQCNTIKKSLNTVDNIISDVEVYPNPFTNEFIVRSKESGSINSIKVYNTQGQVLYQNTNCNGGELIKVKFEAESGYYFLQVETNHQITTRQILKN